MGPQELSDHIKTHLLPLSSLLVRIFPSGTLACLDGKKRIANVVKHSCLAGGSGRHIWQKLQMLMLKHSLYWCSFWRSSWHPKPNIVLFLDIKLTSCCPESCQGFPSLSCVGSEVASIPLELVEWGELCWQPSSFRRDPFQQKIYTQIDDPCFVLGMPISLPCTCHVNASKKYDQNKQHLSLLMKSLWKSLEVTKQNPEIENSTKEISNNIVGENGSMLLCSLKVGFAILFNSVIA